MKTPSATAQSPQLFSGQSGAPNTTEASALSSDFETFLKMLTVQLENQDPLNPVDSADYAVQLATFSSVEQQVLTNDLLTSLTTTMAGGGIGALGQWVGMDVRAGDTAHFKGDPIELATQQHQDADQRILVIRDELGQIATRVNVAASGTDLTWDGTLSNGSIAPSGPYTFSVEVFKDGTLQSTDTVAPYSRVREAIIENGETKLLLEGDILVHPSEVSALRSPD
jgi:flagellar basal-body rod modification protein FlgD